MIRIVLLSAAFWAGLAGASAADETKPKMSLTDVRSDMVVSTKAHNAGKGLYGRPQIVPFFYLLAIVAVAAQ